jgi:tetratricopeptide (TPR) repeat protein
MYKNGNFKEVYTALCDVMEREQKWSKDGDIYTLWAELELLANNDAHKALKLLKKAYEIGCSEIGYYYKVRGDVMLRNDNYEAAIHEYEQSVSVDPSIANLTMLGQALSNADDRRAMGVWQQILSKDSKNCMAHIYIGFELAKSGDRGKALLMAKRAENLNPLVRDVFDIGWLYHELEEFQTAINKYLEANRLGYEDKALLYACIAACHLSLGQADPARNYLQWAEQCNPENEYVKEVMREYEKRFGG